MLSNSILFGKLHFRSWHFSSCWYRILITNPKLQLINWRGAYGLHFAYPIDTPLRNRRIMLYGLFFRLSTSSLFLFLIKYCIFPVDSSSGISFYLIWQIVRRKPCIMFVTNTKNPWRLCLIKETIHSLLSFITLSTFTQHFNSNPCLFSIHEVPNTLLLLTHTINSINQVTHQTNRSRSSNSTTYFTIHFLPNKLSPLGFILLHRCFIFNDLSLSFELSCLLYPLSQYDKHPWLLSSQEASLFV